MKRLLKVILVVVGILVALIVAAAVALPFFIDPNDYKDEIATAVEDKTGREFTMKGDLELSVFPWLGVQIGASRLANAEGFGDKPFAEINNAEVSVRLLPLLRQRIEVGTVSLDGMRLRLARNEAGESNWEDLVQAFSAKEEKQKEQPQPDQEEGGFEMPEIEVGAVEVSDAAVTYSDAGSGVSYELSKVNLSTGRLVMGESFPVELGFTLDASEPAVTSETRLAATVQPDIKSQFYRFSDLSLNVHASGDAIPGGEQQINLTGKGETDLQSGRLKIANFMLQGAGVNITGNVDGSDILGEPSFNGRLTVQQFNPRSVMSNLGMEPPETTDSDALTSAGVDTQFEATLDSAKLDQLLVQLDESTIKGDAAVKNFANPAVTFEMSLDEMNVDRYMPPESEGESETKSTEQTPAGGAEISLDPLKALRLDGRLTAGKLTIANLRFNDAELAVTARDGVLNVQPLGADLYDGNLRMTSRVSAAEETPSYAIKGNLNGLKLGPLLKDLIGQEKVSALANLNIDLTTSGNTVEQIKRTLDGSISFEFRNGVFNGFDLSKILNVARERLLGESAEADSDGETSFSKFAAAFSVNDGLFKGGNLNLTTPYAHLGGEGSFNLVTNQLDYIVNANIPESAEGKILGELAGYRIPIKLSGNLFSPKYSIDVQSALKSVGQQKLEEEKAEVRKKVEEKRSELQKDVDEKVKEKQKELGDKLREELGGLFGGGKKKSKDEQESGGDGSTPEGGATQ